MITTQNNERTVFENVIRSLEAEIVNAGVHLTIDPMARQAYARQIKLMADKLRTEVTSGRMSWVQAAEQA